MSTNIKILGTGCPKCKQTIAIVEDVLRENNIEAHIEKVEDIFAIMNYNVMATPAVVINDVVVLKGRVPSKKELLDLFKYKAPKTDTNSENCCSQDNCC
ncbi:MAG: thioredoxin family protein [Maribacter sp.]